MLRDPMARDCLKKILLRGKIENIESGTGLCRRGLKHQPFKVNVKLLVIEAGSFRCFTPTTRICELFKVRRISMNRLKIRNNGPSVRFLLPVSAGVKIFTTAVPAVARK